MARTLLLWLQENLLASEKIWDFLLTKPYDVLTAWDKTGFLEGYLSPIESFTWLGLLGISGLIVFIGIALIKWVLM